jgi:hypothetical protein
VRKRLFLRWITMLPIVSQPSAKRHILTAS